MTREHTYVVVDTNIVVYMLTGHHVATSFEPYLLGKIGLVLFQTVGQLRFIGLRRKWGASKMRELDVRLRTMVVVPATEQITERWARLMFDQVSAGSRVEIEDAWIAATALVYGWTSSA
jgi:predicted nucleic acid-binding protein